MIFLFFGIFLDKKIAYFRKIYNFYRYPPPTLFTLTRPFSGFVYL